MKVSAGLGNDSGLIHSVAAMYANLHGLNPVA